MKRVWLISNPHSGSTSEDRCEALAALFAEPHATIVGRTTFPQDELPSVTDLIAADTQMVALFAGDGTINAAASLYDAWDGAMLILPGGTMNMLAKRLHGESEPHEIVERSFIEHREVHLPVVEAGRTARSSRSSSGPPRPGAMRARRRGTENTARWCARGASRGRGPFRAA